MWCGIDALLCVCVSGDGGAYQVLVVLVGRDVVIVVVVLVVGESVVVNVVCGCGGGCGVVGLAAAEAAMVKI